MKKIHQDKPPPSLLELGSRIRIALDAQGSTYVSLSRRLGVSRGMISKYCDGTQKPTQARMEEIIDFIVDPAMKAELHQAYADLVLPALTDEVQGTRYHQPVALVTETMRTKNFTQAQSLCTDFMARESDPLVFTQLEELHLELLLLLCEYAPALNYANQMLTNIHPDQILLRAKVMIVQGTTLRLMSGDHLSHSQKLLSQAIYGMNKFEARNEPQAKDQRRFRNHALVQLCLTHLAIAERSGSDQSKIEEILIVLANLRRKNLSTTENLDCIEAEARAFLALNQPEMLRERIIDLEEEAENGSASLLVRLQILKGQEALLHRKTTKALALLALAADTAKNHHNNHHFYRAQLLLGTLSFKYMK